MNTIQDLFQQAQLAEATYANFFSTAGVLLTNKIDVITALIAEGMSDAQATAFVTQWRVVSQQSNTVSGFSATVFEKLDANGMGTGQFTFSVRGSEYLISGAGAIDWGNADISDIGGQGFALHQAIDLYNYQMSLKTTAGASYQAAYLQTNLVESASLAYLWAAGGSINPLYQAAKLGYESAGYWVDGPIVSTLALGDSATVASSGLTLGQQPAGLPANATFDVVGHSLGGHLALLMQRLDAGFVTGVQTFNPPFFDPISSSKLTEQFFLQLQQAEIAVYGSTSIASAFNSALIENYVVPGDIVHYIGDDIGDVKLGMLICM